MPHLDASSLDGDAEGLGFLRSVLDSSGPVAAGPPAAIVSSLRERERRLLALHQASALLSLQLLALRRPPAVKPTLVACGDI